MSTPFSRNLREPRDTKKIPRNYFPTKKELHAKCAPNLAENKIDETYISVAEYIEIHSDLLLEDFMCPLRKSLKDFKRNRKADYYDGARVYHNIRLVNFEVIKRGKFSHTTCSVNFGDKDPKLLNGEREQSYEISPAFGHLLLFTQTDFDQDLFLGKVTSSKDEKAGIVITLKQFKESVLSVDELKQGTFTMMQADSFFYMYENLLYALNTLDEHSFPMKRYIISGNEYTKVESPSYLSESTVYNLGDEKVFALDHSNWPSHEILKLDESQYAAMKRALTKEVTLIQGPPGTGKTYFGVRLVKVLLDNIAVWNPSRQTPLIIVCHTNVALDHFLEELLAIAGTDKFVRIGDHCQSELLKPYNLRELVCRHVAANLNSPSALSLRPCLERIDSLRKLLNQITDGIVSFKTFAKWGVIDDKKAKMFKSGRRYLKWMGFKVKVDERKNCAFTVLIEDLRVQVDELKLYDCDKAERADRELVKICELLLRAIKENEESKVPSTTDILSVSPSDAQRIYIYWVNALCVRLHEKLEYEESQLQRLEDGLPFNIREKAKAQVLRSAYVVGMTSTAASARRNVLEDLQSPIVVIEEAAEVLEAHVVVSMTTACEHLILLGDHKQLKPTTTSHHLAVDYHLNMSLFERLLRNNVVEGLCLTTQYRMRPEISALLKPHFYQTLDDDRSTWERPKVTGLASNLFFLHHEEPEHTSLGDKGYYNSHEVTMLINLARYLVYVGYSPLDVTIISMYGEQRKRLVDERDQDSALEGLEIASVDSFQGKENEIILLSLVRSNAGGQIGFLKEDNRVCVALSRAKRGLYVMGNMKCLTKPSYQSGQFVDKPVWIHVKKRLNEQHALGTELTLVCPVHNAVHRVSREAHWYQAFCDQCTEEQDMDDQLQEGRSGLSENFPGRYSNYGEGSSLSKRSSSSEEELSSEEEGSSEDEEEEGSKEEVSVKVGDSDAAEVSEEEDVSEEDVSGEEEEVYEEDVFGEEEEEVYEEEEISEEEEYSEEEISEEEEVSEGEVSEEEEGSKEEVSVKVGDSDAAPKSRIPLDSEEACPVEDLITSITTGVSDLRLSDSVDSSKNDVKEDSAHYVSEEVFENSSSSAPVSKTSISSSGVLENGFPLNFVIRNLISQNSISENSNSYSVFENSSQFRQK